MKQIQIITAILLALATSGCIDRRQDIKPDRYIGLIAVAAAVANTTQGNNTRPVDPVVPDKPDGVIRTEDCDTCAQKGWLGDGRPRTDCPDCDYDGDGDVNEPLSIFLSQAEGSEYKTQHFSSIVEAKTKEKPILVVFADEVPELLEIKLVDEYISKNYAVVILSNTNEVIEPWAAKADLSPLIIEKDGNYSLSQEAYCVTNSDGSFTKGSTNANLLKKLPSEPLDFIESLQKIQTR